MKGSLQSGKSSRSTGPRMIGIAESTRGSAAHVAWEIADRACREARGGDAGEPKSYSRLPGWFGPRLRRVIGPNDFRSYYPSWVDHAGVVKVTIRGEQVRCFVSEPYPSIKASEGPALSSTPEMQEAEYIAEATGCKLVIHRVAWWNARCFRMLFLPLDHKLPIKDAIARYKPRPLLQVFPNSRRENLFRS